MAALDHKGQEFDKELHKFVKRVTCQHGHNPTAQVVIWRSWGAVNEKGAPKPSLRKLKPQGQAFPGADWTLAESTNPYPRTQML
jgi:hypothetical protein